MTTQASEGNNAQADKCLYISSQVDLEEFWVQILPAFVEMVDPDSGLLIDLYSGGELLTDTDYESLVTGKDHVPRKHRARRLWCILSTYPVGVFNSKLAPKLCARYGLIIPERFRPLTTPVEDPATGHVKPEEECFRHDVQTRVRLESLADLLCHHGCLHVDVYRKLFTTILRNVDEKWCLLFDALAQSPGELLTNPESPLHTLLNRYHVTCPDNIVDIQSRGFPCECKHPQASPPVTEICTETKVLSWRERALSTVRPSSSDSSVTNVDVSSSNLSSSLRPVSAFSGRSDTMATKTSLESHSHFDGMYCNGVGFPPFEKLTKKRFSEVNIRSNGGLQYMPLSRARTDGSLDRSSSNDDECITFNKSAPKSSTMYVTVEQNVSEIAECAGQGQVNVKSTSQMEERKGDVDFPESLEPIMRSGGNYEKPKAEICCIDMFVPMILMGSYNSDIELQMDDTQPLLDQGPSSDDVDYVENTSTSENCIGRFVASYEDLALFTVVGRELHLMKNVMQHASQRMHLYTDKFICMKRKIQKQLLKVIMRLAMLILLILWITGALGNLKPGEDHESFVRVAWLKIWIRIGDVLARLLPLLVALFLPAYLVKIQICRFLTSVWVLWKMVKTNSVVEVV